jgi:ankyrin repeat protein
MLRNHSHTLSGCPLTLSLCRLGQLDCAKCLLALRADANAVDGSGMQEGIRPVTPLSAALLSTAAQPYRRRAIVELLLRHGVDPLAPSHRKRYIALRCATGLQEGLQHSIRTSAKSLGAAARGGPPPGLSHRRRSSRCNARGSSLREGASFQACSRVCARGQRAPPLWQHAGRRQRRCSCRCSRAAPESRRQQQQWLRCG